MGPLATFSYHLEGLTPLTPRSHPQGGVQIYPKGKFTWQNHEKKLCFPRTNLLNSYLINNRRMFNGATDDLAEKPYIPHKSLLQ